MSICVAMPFGQYRDKIIYQLEHHGDHVIAVNRGIDLLDQIRYHNFSHIFLHTDLPDYDALELVLYIRDIYKLTSITIIGKNSNCLKRLLFKAGANHWFSPYENFNTLMHILSPPDSFMLI
ncbi:hypothetical protein JW835_00430 [bacterium]|nr:hypothetical protein [bacterium]